MILNNCKTGWFHAIKQKLYRENISVISLIPHLEKNIYGIENMKIADKRFSCQQIILALNVNLTLNQEQSTVTTNNMNINHKYFHPLCFMALVLLKNSNI